ncbi:MAG: hypothetical protein LR015_14505 [Verrucomicrobia bacterium]|nr:hypothetical protein [Verrucomicrobiota bacterium]
MRPKRGAAFDPPKSSGPLAIFANVDGDTPAAVTGLGFSTLQLLDIQAIGLYHERINTTAGRDFRISEFRVMATLPDEGGPGATPYHAWLERAGYTAAEMQDPSSTGLFADPDNTGWSNAWRYAFGVERDTPSSILLPVLHSVTENGQVFIEFSFLRNTLATDVSLVPELSSNAQDWEELGADWQLYQIIPHDSFPDVERLTWRLNRQLQPEEICLLRLRLSLEQIE